MAKDKFKQWMDKVAAIRDWDSEEMLNDPTYNYRLFYDMQPKEANDMLRKNSDAHFTDIGKTVYHPTFSKESYYSNKVNKRFNPRGIIGGTWSDDRTIGRNGSRYTLSESQMDNNWDVIRTIDYMSKAEDQGATLKLPNGTAPVINGIRFGGVLPEVKVIATRKKK